MSSSISRKKGSSRILETGGHSIMPSKPSSGATLTSSSPNSPGISTPSAQEAATAELVAKRKKRMQILGGTDTILG